MKAVIPKDRKAYHCGQDGARKSSKEHYLCVPRLAGGRTGLCWNLNTYSTAGRGSAYIAYCGSQCSLSAWQNLVATRRLASGHVWGSHADCINCCRKSHPLWEAHPPGWDPGLQVEERSWAAANITLCFLVVPVMWAPASIFCCLDFPVLTDRILWLQA